MFLSIDLESPVEKRPVKHTTPAIALTRIIIVMSPSWPKILTDPTIPRIRIMVLQWFSIPGNFEEFIFGRDGRFVAQFNVDAGQGGAFGIGISALGDDRVRLATVDDNTNYMSVYTLRTED